MESRRGGVPLKNNKAAWAVILGSLSLVPGLFAQTAIAQDSSQAAVEAAESFDKLLLAVRDNDADINSQDEFGQTALVRAALAGNAVLIRSLLEQGANPNLQDYHGKSPLYYAAIYGKADADVVEAFLQKGADVNLPDEFGHSPFMIAAQYNHNVPVLKLMGQHVRDINAADRAGRTALMGAAWQLEFDDSQAIKALLELGADPNRKDFKGETALMKTALLGNAESTLALLQHHGIDVNARSVYGETALTLARQTRLKDRDNADYPRVISLLTKHGAQN